MAAEKAAQQLAHERQMAHAKDDAERVKRYSLHCIAVCVVLMLAKMHIVTTARGWKQAHANQVSQQECRHCLLGFEYT